MAKPYSNLYKLSFINACWPLMNSSEFLFCCIGLKLVNCIHVCLSVGLSSRHSCCSIFVKLRVLFWLMLFLFIGVLCDLTVNPPADL